MKIVVAVSGASGSIYAKVLLDKLQADSRVEKVGLLMSDNALVVWQHELQNDAHKSYPFDRYTKWDFHAPFASGSGRYESMIVCPCSMGVLGRIAAGTSDDLVVRAADVILKERRRLVLVVRDTPYNLIHLNNMKTVTEAGGVICPATPSFYSLPNNFEELAATVVDRALELSGLPQNGMFRWGGDN
jgi:4-hydroxy-3-polyprenylbenzoate decarboxylase